MVRFCLLNSRLLCRCQASPESQVEPESYSTTLIFSFFQFQNLFNLNVQYQEITKKTTKKILKNICSALPTECLGLIIWWRESGEILTSEIKQENVREILYRTFWKYEANYQTTFYKEDKGTQQNYIFRTKVRGKILTGVGNSFIHFYLFVYIIWLIIWYDC